MAQINRDLKDIASSDEKDLNDSIVDDGSTSASDDDVVCLDESGEEREPGKHTFFPFCQVNILLNNLNKY